MTLSIETRTLQVPVVRDGQAVGSLTLRPDDTAFLERFYALGQKLAARRGALGQAGTGAGGAPEQALAELARLCLGVRADIDEAFGPGTSSLVFGEEGCSPSALEQFFTGVHEVLKAERQALLGSYLDE